MGLTFSNLLIHFGPFLVKKVQKWPQKFVICQRSSYMKIHILSWRQKCGLTSNVWFTLHRIDGYLIWWKKVSWYGIQTHFDACLVHFFCHQAIRGLEFFCSIFVSKRRTLDAIWAQRSLKQASWKHTEKYDRNIYCTLIFKIKTW